MTQNKIRYHEFIDDIDLDAFYDAIGFDPLRSINDNDTGYCLFPQNHANGDTTGKFSIHRRKKVYQCWVCGGGSLLSLVMELYGWTPEEATIWLRQFAIRDTRTDAEFVEQMIELLEDKGPQLEPIPYFNSRVLAKFDGPIEYFLGRGISKKVIKACHLCYSDTVIKTAPIKHRDGVPTKTDNDYVGPAAIFPHFWKGQLVGWQHRWLGYPDYTPKWLPKYTNTSSFPKHNTLYNYEWALTRRERIVICESVPTTLFLRSIGIPAVAYFGDAPSQEQLKMLRKFTQGVILAPDNDSNGDKLLNQATKYLESYIPVWHIPKVGIEHGDLGDYAYFEDGAQLVYEHLDLAEPSYIATQYEW